MSKPIFYPVFGYRLASFLMERGFMFNHTDFNHKNPKWKVFYFIQTDALLAAVDEYKEAHNG